MAEIQKRDQFSHRMANLDRSSGRQNRRNRAQSEPLAALVSVGAVCLAISLAVVLFTDAVSRTGENREVAEPTADAIGQDLRSDSAYNADIPINTSVERSSLPEGYAVAIEVTTVDDDGRRIQAGNAQFDSTGDPIDTGPPDDTQRVTRPIPVRLRPGDVRPGRLVVEVWG